MSLFFVAYAGIKDKRSMYYVIFVLTVVLLLIVGYGFGQRFLGLPAFLTMNEEFAKGIPIQLGAFSRISSTFAGHYDLAAYLVLIIPILTSLIFGFKNIFIKIVLLITSLLGFVLLFMTISRVSFVVLLVALGIVFMFQKKRLVIISAGVLMVMLLVFSQPLLARFGSTVTEVEVLVHAKTGIAIGPVKQVQKTYFEDILITIKEHNQSQQSSSISAIFPYSHVPETAALVVEPNRAGGEDLSQGTSYINLSLSPVTKKVKLYFFEKTNTASKEADVYFGEFVIKKAKAYDLSATTRFQGEWPRTLEAFRKNIFLGSGYGAVSLAVDNNYLRILGESGLFGLLSFISIFLFAMGGAS
jgi:O-antigen ligase